MMHVSEEITMIILYIYIYILIMFTVINASVHELQ